MALYDFRSIYFPYCLMRQKDGRYLVLNREYKPIGFNTIEHIDYENYPISAKITGITKKVAIGLSISKSNNLEQIFLYDDATNPSTNSKNLKAYLKKLEKLANFKAE